MKEDNASSTAYTVLQGLLYTAGKAEYNQLVDEETRRAGKLILSNTKEGRRRLQQLDSGVSRFFLRAIEKIMLPGITLHYALRKRFIETHVVEAIENGVTQVVNLGAGFDTLAWRLHSRYPNVEFIEIDHPATSREKNEALTSTEQSGANLHLLAVDLSDRDLGEVLKSNDSFDAARETLFICEGVLMYLDIAAITSLFKALKNFNNKSKFIFTATAPMDSNNNNASWLLKLYLKLNNEPLNWAIEPDEIKGFLHQQKYELVDLAGGVEMHGRYLDQAIGVLHRGEFAVASRVASIS